MNRNTANRKQQMDNKNTNNLCPALNSVLRKGRKNFSVELTNKQINKQQMDDCSGYVNRFVQCAPNVKENRKFCFKYVVVVLQD